MSFLIYPKSDKRLISSFDGEHARHEKGFTKKSKKENMQNCPFCCSD